jgi:hypothetical protein
MWWVEHPCSEEWQLRCGASLRAARRLLCQPTIKCVLVANSLQGRLQRSVIGVCML